MTTSAMTLTAPVPVPVPTMSSETAHIVQISDIHVCAEDGAITTSNFRRVVEYVNEDLRPDMVIITGDLALVDPDNADDRAAAATLIASLHAPTMVVPGNHDVGEVGPAPWMGIDVTSERVRGYRTTFGSGSWLRRIGPLAVLGLDVQLLDTTLPEADEQWEWLEGMAVEVNEAPALLFMHKPLATLTDKRASENIDETSPGEHPVSLSVSATRRLLTLLGTARLLAVGSGHLHRYSQRRVDGTVHVSAPSTAFVVADKPYLPAGESVLGVVSYSCTAAQVQARLMKVDGLVTHDVFDLPEIDAAVAHLLAT